MRRLPGGTLRALCRSRRLVQRPVCAPKPCDEKAPRYRTSTHGDETFEVAEWLVRICFEVVRRSFDLESRGQGGRRPQSARRLTLVAKRLASTLAELAPQTIILIDANQRLKNTCACLNTSHPVQTDYSLITHSLPVHWHCGQQKLSAKNFQVHKSPCGISETRTPLRAISLDGWSVHAGHGPAKRH